MGTDTGEEISRTEETYIPTNREVDIKTYISEVNLAINEAEVRTNYRFSPDSQNPQDYHIWDHPDKMGRRGVALAEAVRKIDGHILNDYDIQLIKLAIAFHDIVQNIKNPSQLTPDQQKVVNTLQEVRVRDRGWVDMQTGEKGNEGKTYDEILAYMEARNRATKKQLYPIQDQKLMEQMIEGTVPGWDPKLAVVTQPNIRKGDPILKIIVALADLGGPGMDGAEQFTKEGNAEFRELKVGVTRFIRKALKESQGDTDKALGNIKSEDRIYIVTTIVEWIRDQVKFVRGRKMLLPMQLGVIEDENIRQAILSQFTKFDDSINASEERVKKLQELGFYLNDEKGDLIPNKTFVEQAIQKIETFKMLLQMVGYI